MRIDENRRCTFVHCKGKTPSACILAGASRHTIAYVSRMNDATPIRDFRGQPTDEPLELDEAVPAHARAVEPQPEVVIEEADLAPPPVESKLVDAMATESEPASHPSVHPNDDVIDAIVDEPVHHVPVDQPVQHEPLHHEPEPVDAPIEHAPAMEAPPAIIEPEPTVVPMESPPVAADAEDAPSEDEQPNVVTAGIGILLVNLGTPDAADAPAVRRYLQEFLSDPRVIERNGWLWRFVLNWLILPLRPRRKARDYAKIWNKERNESPFKTITRSQAEKLASIIEPLG
ncbi:MAG: ferrochelatase, partial [Bradyrhizobium sp.]